jgi:hypothetical protein
MLGAYLGDVGRVRVFYDGLEVDPLDPRMGGALDLGSIQIWSAEEVRVERGADELRVHIRSWRARRTTPYTRADVGTGDQETNLYRGFFGRRFQRGEALQVAAQQLSTTPSRLGASANHAAVHARVGWAGGWWSIDAALLRATPNRGAIFSAQRRDTILSLAATETDAYLRVAYGDPDAGPWAQLILGGQEHRFRGHGVPATETPDVEPDLDTTRYQAQYTLTGGVTWRGLRLSATDRLRASDGTEYHSPAVRVSFTSALLAASLLAEARGENATPRADAIVRFTPLPFVSIGGAAAVARADGPAADVTQTTAFRAEAAVRLWGLWLGGGLIRRDAASVPPPVIFSRRYRSRLEGQASGIFVTVRGRIWGALFADATGVQWQDDGGFYRPRYQARSELYVATTLPRRFPSGNFGLLASLQHEYRSHALFPATDGVDRAGGFRALSGLVEIRILQAVLSYQYRNMLVEQYTTVPDYLMPRQTQFYGVRWEFWN